MCPLCDEDIGCQYWYLSDVCLFVKVAYLFDHPGTVFYAIFVSFWGKFLLLECIVRVPFWGFIESVDFGLAQCFVWEVSPLLQC